MTPEHLAHMQEMLAKAPENIVVVGPPRSGKSTLAIALYDKLTADGFLCQLLTGSVQRNRRDGDNYPRDITIWDMNPPYNVLVNPFTRWISLGALITKERRHEHAGSLREGAEQA